MANIHTMQTNIIILINHVNQWPGIMVYGSTPYVGMAPKKNGGHIKSAHRNVCIRLVKGLYEPYQALPSASMGNGSITFGGEYR